jgi:DNA modification methylase
MKNPQEKMDLKMVPIEKLKPAAYNPRRPLKPGDPEFEKLKRSIQEFGHVYPVVVNKDMTIIGGHQTVSVLKALGYKSVQASVVDLNKAKEKILNVALNKISGEWDFEKLSELMIEINSEVDISLTGFDETEINRIIGDHQGLADPDDVPLPRKKAITKKGDLISLGNHRLICGDSTLPADIGRLMGNKKAVLMNTDPPYGVNYGDVANSRERAADKRKGGSGKVKRDKYIQNDELDGKKLQEFLEASIRSALPHLIENPAFYLWHPMLTQGTFFEAAAAAAADILIHRQIIWVKPSLIMGRGDYHWRHELCFYGWIRGKKCQWLAGRDQDTIWEVGRENDGIHPTQKPVELFLRPIKNHTHVGDIIYEPFAGSGSQFIAAEQSDRRCFGIEIDPIYCDVIIDRWESFTGRKASRKSS